MVDGDFRARADASHDQLCVEKFKSGFCLCIGMGVLEEKIVLGLCQFYLHADARDQKL